MSLYQDMRPKTFKDVFGNESTCKSLSAMVKKAPDKRPHAIMFYGPSGCGKTTLARIVAKGFGCSDLDFTEMDAAKDRSVEAVRGIVADAQYSPLDGSCRVFLIDEAHELPKLSQETLLKSTEDTPPSTYFILCTTEPEKIILTLRNRCTSFQVQCLRDQEMMDLFTTTIDKSGHDQEAVSDNVLDKLIEAANGSPRRGLVLLEQVLNLEKEEDQLEVICGEELQNDVLDLCRALIRGASWKEISTIYKAIPQTDPEAIRRAMLGYFKSVLLQNGKNAGDIYAIACLFRDNYYDTGESGLILDLYGAHARVSMSRDLSGLSTLSTKNYAPGNIDELGSIDE